MASTNIATLKNRYRGSTICVLASGASMGFLPAKFLDQFITVGVNEVHRDFPCDFVVAHHADVGQEVIDKGLQLVASVHDCADFNRPLSLFNGDWYQYKHRQNVQTAGIDLSVMDTDDHLAVSASTTAEAVHFAFHIGASFIMLCGADHGRLDGNINYTGYNTGPVGGTLPAHLPLTEPLLLKMVNAVRERGVPVVSLNPFINPGMEGHKYSRPPAGSVFISAPQVMP